MARIDRILSLVADQGANELRMGTDREPKMLAYGTSKRLSIPMTDETTLRDLLGEILSPEREEALKTRGRVECHYDAAQFGQFSVSLTSRTDGFDVVFRQSGRAAPPPVQEPPPPPSVHPTSHQMPVATPASASMPVAMHAPMPMTVAEPIRPASSLMELVAHAAARRASDLHLADDEVPVARIDGRLQRLEHAPSSVASLLPLGEFLEAELARTSSIDFGLEIADVGRVRVHVFRTETGRCASLRLLPRSAPTLASLGLPIPIDDLIELPHGLVMVCGSAGSGKSTTLAALAQEALKRRSIMLVTLEDPIEYGLTARESSLVRRRQVGRDVPDFASGLRDALREDPDVILIGEMRDPETISLALTAAETGHLVLTSLHSRSAASAIERIVDAYPPERSHQIRSQLADSLRAVVSQRLVPRARGTGRIVALEVMRTSHAVGSLIREGKVAQLSSAIQAGRKDGMLLLERCLADRVAAGEIRIEDARAAANDPAALALLGK